MATRTPEELIARCQRLSDGSDNCDDMSDALREAAAALTAAQAEIIRLEQRVDELCQAHEEQHIAATEARAELTAVQDLALQERIALVDAKEAAEAERDKATDRMAREVELQRLTEDNLTRWMRLHAEVAAERDRLREALNVLTDSVERMALRLDQEPDNQTVVAIWLHHVKEARAALSSGDSGQDVERPGTRTHPELRVRGRRLQRLRRNLFQRHPLCVLCLAQGRTTPATVRDHILNLQAGGTDTEDNVQAICEQCHEVKTQAEAKRGITWNR